MNTALHTPDGPASKLAPGFDGLPIDLVRLAKAQRLLIWFCLARILAEITLIRTAAVSGGGASGLLVWIYAAVVLASAVVIARFARAYGMNWYGAAVMSVPLAAPCLGAVVLPLLNNLVTNTLRKAGAPVGFMGVPPRGLHRLLLNACSTCGYDLRGIDGAVCPECGSSRSAPRAATE